MAIMKKLYLYSAKDIKDIKKKQATHLSLMFLVSQFVKTRQVYATLSNDEFNFPIVFITFCMYTIIRKYCEDIKCEQIQGLFGYISKPSL